MSDQKLTKPKHRQIFEYVHTAIHAGKYAAGHKLPSDGQLMRRFETSRPTVARAMRDLERAGFIERRAGSGSFVRTPVTAARSLLGLLIPGLGETEIFEPICGELARSCHQHNFSLLWGNSPSPSGDQAGQAELLCRQYIEQKVAGVFFAPLELTPEMHQTNRQIAEALERAGIAVVLLDRDVEIFPRRSKFDVLGIDNFRAGYLQAEHMLGLGCRRIAYLARPMSASTVDIRIAGYQHALKTHGVTPEDNWIFRGEPTDLEFVRQIADLCSDAILCANDITAANLMRSLIQLGVAVPQEVRVMGLDDVKYAQLFSVPLTTLAQPCRKMGIAAVATMIQRLENRSMPPRSIFLDVNLVVRDSCGASLES